MSDDSCADVANDEDFFDEPFNRRSANETSAAEQRPMRSSDVVTTSPHRRSRRRSSDDESSSDHSLEGKRRSAVEEESLERRTSSSGVTYDAVVPLPPDSQHDVAHDSKTSERRSTEHKEPVREQPSCHKKKNQKSAVDREAKTVGRGRRSHNQRNNSEGSFIPHRHSGYSSDEEKRHLETTCHSRRSVSSTSTGGSQERGTYRNSRTLSAPFQSRSVSAFSNGSRMDVKMLLESLLQAENSRPRRRKSVADPVEFRRKRNYTFSDQRLEMIERENKRLLEKIVTINYSQPTYSLANQTRTAPVKPMIAFPDIARIKQLEKIEKENLELLRRIQSTQPSRDICRAALLADYSRNRAYLDRGYYCIVPPAKSNRRRHSNSEPRRTRFE